MVVENRMCLTIWCSACFLAYDGEKKIERRICTLVEE